MLRRPVEYRIVDRGLDKEETDVTDKFPAIPIKPTWYSPLVEKIEGNLHSNVALMENSAKKILAQVDAFMIESVLLGALAFTGFVTIICSTYKMTDFFGFCESIKRSIVGSQVLLSEISTSFSKATTGSENIKFLILLEALFASVSFVLVLAQRIRFYYFAYTLDYLIRLMNTYLAKIDELDLILIDHPQDNNLILRQKQWNERIDLAMEDTKEHIARLTPIVFIMSMLRNTGLILFYLVLITSGLLVSPSVTWIVVCIAGLIFFLRLLEKLMQTPTNYQKRKKGEAFSSRRIGL